MIVNVNGKEIHRSDMLTQMKVMAGRGMRLNPQQVIDQLIVEELLYEEAVGTGNVAAASEVEETYDSILIKVDGQENLEAQLQQIGTNPDAFKSGMNKQLSINKLIDKITAGKVTISDASVEEFYNNNPQMFENVHASHILITSKPGDSDEMKAEAKRKIEEIAEQIKAGSDFAELAKTESACPSSARGGDLGTFGKGQMVPSFEEAAFALEAGQVSDIVETQFGYHIIKVEEHNNPTLDEVREDLKQDMENKERNKIIEDYIKKLREKASIEFTEAPAFPQP